MSSVRIVTDNLLQCWEGLDISRNLNYYKKSSIFRLQSG